MPKEIYTIGEQPAPIDPSQNRSIEENLLWQKYLHSVLDTSVDETGRQPWSVAWMRNVYELGQPIHPMPVTASCWAIDDIYQEPLFRTLAPFFNDTTIRSALIISLKHGTQVLGCLTFFRDSIDTEILWAGYHHPDTRQLMARQSFEVWRQLKKKQAQRWTKEEIQYAQVLGERFAATIKQYQLYQQVQALNENLEQQVEERTEELIYRSEQLERSNAELKRLVERQTMLSRIVTKIRDSLDIQTIFRTTTEEVRHLLNVDRVVVYRFEEDWSGEFVAESVAKGWVSLLDKQLNDPVLKDNMDNVLQLLDIGYIGLKKQNLFNYGVSPNKLFDYMMAALPVIYAVEASNDTVSDCNCGVSVPAENPDAVVDAVMKIKGLSEEEKIKMGQNGKEYVLANHMYEGLADKFLNALKK